MRGRDDFDTVADEHGSETSGEQSTPERTGVPSTSGDIPSKDADLHRCGTDAEAKKDNNPIGRINNLVTTDLNTLQGGQTFILVGKLQSPWH